MNARSSSWALAPVANLSMALALGVLMSAQPLLAGTELDRLAASVAVDPPTGAWIEAATQFHLLDSGETALLRGLGASPWTDSLGGFPLNFSDLRERARNRSWGRKERAMRRARVPLLAIDVKPSAHVRTTQGVSALTASSVQVVATASLLPERGRTP